MILLDSYGNSVGNLQDFCGSNIEITCTSLMVFITTKYFVRMLHIVILFLFNASYHHQSFAIIIKSFDIEIFCVLMTHCVQLRKCDRRFCILLSYCDIRTSMG